MFTDNDIKNFVISVTDTQAGVDFIYYIVDSFGTFTNRLNFSNSDNEIFAKTVKKEMGEFILDLVREHNFEKYIEIQQKRSNDKWKTLN